MLEDPVSKIIIILLIIITTSIIVRLVAYLMNKMKRFKKDITLIYLIRDIINYIIKQLLSTIEFHLDKYRLAVVSAIFPSAFFYLN